MLAFPRAKVTSTFANGVGARMDSALGRANYAGTVAVLIATLVAVAPTRACVAGARAAVGDIVAAARATCAVRASTAAGALHARADRAGSVATGIGTRAAVGLSGSKLKC